MKFTYLALVACAFCQVQAQNYQYEGINSKPSWKEHIGGGWEKGTLRFRTSVYTVHYNPKPEHNNHQKLINVEYIRSDDWLVGLAVFRNSFGQPTQYVYLGKDWTLWQPTPDWRLRGTLTAGLLHGYKDEYKNKIPFNNLGIAPAILPMLGLQYKNIFLEAHFFATAGVMSTVGFTYDLDK